MGKNSNPTQTAMVLDHLAKYGHITPLEAYSKYGIMRLGARIWELRHTYGYDIAMEKVTAKNRFGVKVSFADYSLHAGKLGEWIIVGISKRLVGWDRGDGVCLTREEARCLASLCPSGYRSDAQKFIDDGKVSHAEDYEELRPEWCPERDCWWLHGGLD